MEQKNYTIKSKYKQLTIDDQVIIESFLRKDYFRLMLTQVNRHLLSSQKYQVFYIHLQ